MPTPENVHFFATAAELRAWFAANHDTATELWLGYHRKRTGRPSVTWQEVVDQELCFGWIDSVRYSLGDDRVGTADHAAAQGKHLERHQHQAVPRPGQAGPRPPERTGGV